MNLWLRLLRVLIAAAFGRRIEFAAESRLQFRVMPHDLDLNLHMNNARYLSVMDLGRLDLLVRGGLMRLLMRERWQPVLGGSLIRFRRPLAPFQSYTLISRPVAWDDKWLYIEHHIEVNGGYVCSAYVRGAFVGRNGVIPPARIVQEVRAQSASPPLPAWRNAWSNTSSGYNPQPVQSTETGAV